MSRYRATIRQTTAREFTVEVEAESRIQALRLAGDPDNWVSVDKDAPLGDEKDEVLDTDVMDAEAIEDDDAET